MSKFGKTIALITARGGSKRLPGKNIRLLGNKPLLHWAVEAALKADGIDQVVLSTDCQEIAECGKAAGADVPFIRPVELAGDTSSHYSVISHALKWYEKTQKEPIESIVLLQPTSPFRTATHIEHALALRARSNSESLVSVKPVTQHPMFMQRLSSDGHLSPFENYPTGYQRSQDQEELYVLNGAIYVFSPEAFHARESVVAPSPLAFVMDARSSIDIDTLEDFKLCEALLAYDAAHHLTDNIYG